MFANNQAVEIQGFDFATGETWEPGKVRKPRASELPKPGDDWYVVQFDDGKARLYVHQTRLRAAGL